MSTEIRYVDCPISQHFGETDGSSMYLINDAAVKWSEDRTSIGFFPTVTRNYQVHESFGVLAVITCSDGNTVFCIDAERIWIYRDGHANPKVVPLDDKLAVDVSGPVAGCAAIAIRPHNFVISLLFAEYLVVLVLVDGVLSVQVITCIDAEKTPQMMNLVPTSMEMWFDININTIWIVCNGQGSELNTFSFVVNDNKPLIDQISGEISPVTRGKVHLQRQLGYLMTDEIPHLSWISALSRNINYDASCLLSVSGSGGSGAYTDCFGVTGDLYGGIALWENALPPDEVDEDGDVIIIFGPKPFYLDPICSYKRFGNGAIRCISVDYSTVTSLTTSYPTVWVADVSGYVYGNKYDTQLKSLFRLHTVFFQGYDRIMGLYTHAIDLDGDGQAINRSQPFSNQLINHQHGSQQQGLYGDFDEYNPLIEVQIIDQNHGDDSSQNDGSGSGGGGARVNNGYRLGTDTTAQSHNKSTNHFASSVMSPLTQYQSEYLLENKESMFGDSHSAVIRGEGDGSILHIVDNDDLHVQDSAAFSMKKATEVANPYNGHVLSVLSGTGRVSRLTIHKSVASVISTMGSAEITESVDSLVMVNNLSFYEAYGVARSPIVVRHSVFFPLLNLLAIATSDFRLTVWHIDNFTGVHREAIEILQSFDIQEVTSLASHEMMLSDPDDVHVGGNGGSNLTLTALLYVGYRSGRVDEFSITNQAGIKQGRHPSRAHAHAQPSESAGADSVFSQSQDPADVGAVSFIPAAGMEDRGGGGGRNDFQNGYNHSQSLDSHNSHTTATDAGYAQYIPFVYHRPAAASRLADVVHNNLPSQIASHELKQYSTMGERQSKRDAVLQRREEKKNKEAREKQEREEKEKERRRTYRNRHMQGVQTQSKGLHSRSQGNLLDGVGIAATAPGRPKVGSSKPMTQTLKDNRTGIGAQHAQIAGAGPGDKISLPPKAQQKVVPVHAAIAAGSVTTGVSGGINLLELVHASSYVSRLDMDHQQGEYGYTNYWSCTLTHTISYSPLPLTAIVVSKATDGSTSTSTYAPAAIDAESVTHLILCYCMQYIVVCDRRDLSKSIMKIQLNDSSAMGMTISRLLFPNTEAGRDTTGGAAAATSGLDADHGGLAVNMDSLERVGGVYLVLFGEKSVKLLDCLSGKLAKEFALSSEYVLFDNNDLTLSLTKRSTLASSVNQQGFGSCSVTVFAMAQWQLFDNTLLAPPVGADGLSMSALSLIFNEQQQPGGGGGGTGRKPDMAMSGHAAFSRSNSCQSLDSNASSTTSNMRTGAVPKVNVDSFLHEFVGVYVTTSGDLYAYNAGSTEQSLILNIFSLDQVDPQENQQRLRGATKPAADRIIQGMNVFTDSITSPLVLVWTMHTLYVFRLSFELPSPPSFLQSATVSHSMLSANQHSLRQMNTWSDGGDEGRAPGLGQSNSFVSGKDQGVTVLSPTDSVGMQQGTKELKHKHLTFGGSKEEAGGIATGGVSEQVQPLSYEVKVVRAVQFNLLSPAQEPTQYQNQYRYCRARIVYASPMKHPQFDEMTNNTDDDVVYDNIRAHKAIVLLSDGTFQVLHY